MRAGDSFKDKVAAWRGNAEVAGKSPTKRARASRRQGDVRVREVERRLLRDDEEERRVLGQGHQAGRVARQIEAPDFITVRQTLTVGEKKTPLTSQLKRDNSPSC
jgi:hypothetical protein